MRTFSWKDRGRGRAGCLRWRYGSIADDNVQAQTVEVKWVIGMRRSTWLLGKRGENLEAGVLMSMLSDKFLKSYLNLGLSSHADYQSDLSKNKIFFFRCKNLEDIPPIHHKWMHWTIENKIYNPKQNKVASKKMPAPQKGWKTLENSIRGSILFRHSMVFLQMAKCKWQDVLPPVTLHYEFHSELIFPGSSHKSIIQMEAKQALLRKWAHEW